MISPGFDEDLLNTPLVVWELTSFLTDDDDKSLLWCPVDPESIGNPALQAAKSTYNWSRNFVGKLELCPWAKTSLETPGAIQFFVVSGEFVTDEATARRIVEEVARRFVQTVLPQDMHMGPSLLERAAIYFVLFPTKDSSPSFFVNDFPEFYNWFFELEERWDDDDLQDIIAAPFHPDWEFSVDDNNEEEEQQQRALSYEKKSPVPLVSLVSARVVDQAGESVTAKIASHNQQILLDQINQKNGIDTLKQLWMTALYPESRAEN
ncbi:DUF1415 domain containing protein [Nitzschia inconspicua]|uniref:DUF1415 domain containing protein n=1 Tax=Nitzschia inconspicua TaxID=303405 RepID=A0A9K3LEE8_9STRA|nr:DUF1415 domain containing protein [Nitzschia inconspicua]